MHSILLHIATCLYMASQADYTLESVDLVGHEDRSNYVAFSPDGTLLGSGSRDSSVRLWDVASGKLITVLEERECWPMAVRFSPNGNMLAVGWADGAIHFWDVATRTLARRLDDHMDPAADVFSLVADLAFSPDGRTLASAGDDQTIRIWDVASGRQRHIAKLEDVVHLVVFSHDGSMLASLGFDGIIRVWNVASGEQRFEFDPAGVDVDSIPHVLAFSLDDRLLACAGFGPDIRLWDLKSGEPHTILKGKAKLIRSLSFLPSKNLLLTSGADKAIKIWDFDKQAEKASLSAGATSYDHCVTLSSDGHIVAGLANGEVVLWSLVPPLYVEEGRIKIDHDEIDALEVAQRKPMLAVGSRDGTVTIVRWKKKASP